MHGAGKIEQHAKIEMLPDDVLLEIFDCFRLDAVTDPDPDRSDDPSSPAGLACQWCPWEWNRLVHVCRRWRFLVFASPHRLDLRLVYTFKRPARLRKKALNSWPTLPIAIWYPWKSAVGGQSSCLEDENNASFALRYPDRIREINLFLTGSLLLKLGAVLVSFPSLEYLRLESQYPAKSSPALPVGFLGGSTPRLRDIYLIGIAFPTLPLLLLSTRDLISLRLDKLSAKGCFSPEALSIGLSMTTQLKFLRIQFLPLASRFSRGTGSAGRPLKACTVLPALSEFHFCGDGPYLEDLVSRLDTPVLEQLKITFLLPSSFDTLQLSQFISRTKSLASPHQMSIMLLGEEIFVASKSQYSPLSKSSFLLKITCYEPDIHVTLPNILTRLSPLLPDVQQLSMTSFIPWSLWLDPVGIDSALWLDFFRRLKSVTRLKVGCMFVPRMESALGQLPEEMVRRVLPALQDLYVGTCPTHRPFQKFADAREVSGRPLNVYYAAPLPPPNTTHLNESGSSANS